MMKTRNPGGGATTFWERTLAKYGLATVLALWFFWWITAEASGTMREIRTTLGEHVVENSFYLRAICLNSAHDDAQRASCVPPAAAKHSR